jgi:hypothetical protein
VYLHGRPLGPVELRTVDVHPRDGDYERHRAEVAADSTLSEAFKATACTAIAVAMRVRAAESAAEKGPES